jgi:hypothetical protein
MNKNDVIKKVDQEIKIYRKLLHDVEMEYNEIEKSLNEKKSIKESIEKINFAQSVFQRSEGDNYAGATYYTYSLYTNGSLLKKVAQSGFKFKLTSEQCQYIVENEELYYMDNLKSYLDFKSFKYIETLKLLKDINL